MFVTAKINKQKDILFLLCKVKGGFVISSYLIKKYRGLYRIKTVIDKKTNSFPRKLDGTYEDIDIYIDCANKNQISYFGHGILELYCPSLGRGRNIIKAIKEQFYGEEIIFNVRETSEEVLFQFNAKDMERLEKILKPRTSGANISPFSSRNLPRNKAYKIPDEDLCAYKNLISNLAQNQLILLGKYTTSFLQSFTTKKNTWDDIKSDMALKGLKGKEYIHSIGKWDEYINFLSKNI